MKSARPEREHFHAVGQARDQRMRHRQPVGGGPVPGFDQFYSALDRLAPRHMPEHNRHGGHHLCVRGRHALDEGGDQFHRAGS